MRTKIKQQTVSRNNEWCMQQANRGENLAQKQGVYVLYQISRDQDADIAEKQTENNTLSRKRERGYRINNRID